MCIRQKQEKRALILLLHNLPDRPYLHEMISHFYIHFHFACDHIPDYLLIYVLYILCHLYKQEVIHKYQQFKCKPCKYKTSINQNAIMTNETMK